MPDLGRWITPDPAGYTDGLNLYAYVHNDPLAYIDPDGRLAFLLIPFAISLAIDYCLPTVALLAEEYAGGTMAAAFVVGMAKGYQGDISLTDLDPSSWGCSTAGMVIGGLLSVKDLPKKGAVAASKVAARAIGSAATSIAERVVTKTVQSCTTKAESALATKTAQFAEQKILGKGTSTAVSTGTRNRLKPDPLAIGEHTVFRRNPVTNGVTHYETFRLQTNPRNPNFWESVIRFDGNSLHPHAHYNKVLKQDIYTPHVHDPLAPGGVRIPKFLEIP